MSQKGYPNSQGFKRYEQRTLSSSLSTRKEDRFSQSEPVGVSTGTLGSRQTQPDLLLSMECDQLERKDVESVRVSQREAVVALCKVEVSKNQDFPTSTDKFTDKSTDKSDHTQQSSQTSSRVHLQESTGTYAQNQASDHEDLNSSTVSKCTFIHSFIHLNE